MISAKRSSAEGSQLSKGDWQKKPNWWLKFAKFPLSQMKGIFSNQLRVKSVKSKKFLYEEKEEEFK